MTFTYEQYLDDSTPIIVLRDRYELTMLEPNGMLHYLPVVVAVKVKDYHPEKAEATDWTNEPTEEEMKEHFVLSITEAMQYHINKLTIENL